MDDIHSGTSSSSSGDQTELRRRRPPCNSPDSLTRRTRRSVHYSSPVVTSHAQSSTFFPSSTCSDCPALSPASWAPALLSELKRLISNPRSLFFRNPIDLSTYPDYPCIVSSPMDLSTITRHLNTVLSSAHQCRSLRSMPKTHYRCAHDCLRDLNLIVTNSKKYNTDPNTAVYEDTVWLESWITETFVPFISNTLSTTHSPSPGPNHSESRSVRSARRMTHRTPMRQSNLACRRLALRKARSRCIRQRLSGLKAATSIAPESTVAATRHVRIPEPPPSFPRTSRGRIVRPPKRDEHIVIFSDTDVSDSDEHSRIAKVTRRTTTAQTVTTRSACFVYESLVGSSNLGSRRSKRRRRVL
ncbi:unnamed protein product [Dicrocoelium dendriticum]|nr:unnamed protein product [Dicrocoelium dendriticum]